jgi:hypothetical protein
MFKFDFSNSNSNEDPLNNLYFDRNFITSTIENVAASLDKKGRPIPLMPGDKLHRVCIDIFFNKK